MNIVRFMFSGEEVSVEAYDQLNLLAHAQIAERSLQSRCGGHCECCTCRIILVDGELSTMRAQERELLRLMGVNDPRVRLACQAFPGKSCPAVLVEVPHEKFVDARGQRRK